MGKLTENGKGVKLTLATLITIGLVVAGIIWRGALLAGEVDDHCAKFQKMEPEVAEHHTEIAVLKGECMRMQNTLDKVDRKIDIVLEKLP